MAGVGETNPMVANWMPVKLPDGSTLKLQSIDNIVPISNDEPFGFFARSADGKLYAWGNNITGWLGIGANDGASHPAEVILPPGVTFDSIDDLILPAGNSASVFLLASNKRLYSWGENGLGQLGNGTVVNAISPTEVLLPAGMTIASKDNVLLKDGASSFFALLSDGKLYAWGNNQDPLGVEDDNRLISTPLPVNFLEGNTLRSMADFKANDDKNIFFAILSDGFLYGWGQGFLGVGGTDAIKVPTKVVLPDGKKLASIGDLTLIGENQFARMPDGTLYAWGKDGFGGNTSNAVPTLVHMDGTLDSIDNLTFSVNPENDRISAYALLSNSKLYAWGYNEQGQLGVDMTRSTIYIPAEVKFPVSVTFQSMKNVFFTGNNHVFAIGPNGSLYAWGENSLGTLGIGNTDASIRKPTRVSFSNDLSIDSIDNMIYNTNSAIYALLSDGKLYAWGNNNSSIGLGGGTDTITEPQKIVFPNDLSLKSLNNMYFNDGTSTFAILSDNSLYAWGKNKNGRLGIGPDTGVNVNTPSKVVVEGTLKGIDHLFSRKDSDGENSMIYALFSDDKFYGWGNNADSQLQVESNAHNVYTPSLVVNLPQ